MNRLVKIKLFRTRSGKAKVLLTMYNLVKYRLIKPIKIMIKKIHFRFMIRQKLRSFLMPPGFLSSFQIVFSLFSEIWGRFFENRAGTCPPGIWLSGKFLCQFFSDISNIALLSRFAQCSVRSFRRWIALNFIWLKPVHRSEPLLKPKNKRNESGMWTSHWNRNETGQTKNGMRWKEKTASPEKPAGTFYETMKAARNRATAGGRGGRDEGRQTVWTLKLTWIIFWRCCRNGSLQIQRLPSMIWCHGTLKFSGCSGLMAERGTLSAYQVVVKTHIIKKFFSHPLNLSPI